MIKFEKTLLFQNDLGSEKNRKYKKYAPPPPPSFTPPGHPKQKNETNGFVAQNPENWPGKIS